MHLPHHIGIWSVIDSGRKPGADQMDIDAEALDMMLNGTLRTPLVRFFQWAEPLVSYGYLLDRAMVERWADENGGVPAVKRPTGGGAVLHTTNDLNISFLWPRSVKTLSKNPRACYAQIHEALQKGLSRYLNANELRIADCRLRNENPSRFNNLNNGRDVPALSFNNESGTKSEIRNPKLSICFNEPVCNDVMIGQKKVIGGALRLTKRAILYQGTIQSSSILRVEAFKGYLAEALRPLLNPDSTVPSVPTRAPALTVLS